MGYVAGPRAIVQEIAKFQQYTYVCAPSMAQWGVLPSFGVDLAPMVTEYERRRQMVVDAFAGVTELARPSGAFYAFVKVPERLGLTGHQFVERAIDRRVLAIPGGVFSRRDTHFRLSFATKPSVLAEGLGSGTSWSPADAHETPHAPAWPGRARSVAYALGAVAPRVRAS
jgi:aspartate/methionine/tyrosine aminotransferase